MAKHRIQTQNAHTALVQLEGKGEGAALAQSVLNIYPKAFW